LSCPSKVLFVEKTARSGKSWGLYVGGFWKLCFDPQKEQQIKIEGEFCLCATRRGFVAVYIEKVGVQNVHE
jgi:hypothetical protein